MLVVGSGSGRYGDTEITVTLEVDYLKRLCAEIKHGHIHHLAFTLIEFSEIELLIDQDSGIVILDKLNR